MGRALQRLSHELYSRDSHFVLELVQVRGGFGMCVWHPHSLPHSLLHGLHQVSFDALPYPAAPSPPIPQNADDNKYPPGAVPSLEFLITEDEVRVTNNEVWGRVWGLVCWVGSAAGSASPTTRCGGEGVGCWAGHSCFGDGSNRGSFPGGKVNVCAFVALHGSALQVISLP